ncbi:MAG: YkgJ family cysteine cluster protein [Candidatus Sumerlaeia bacterium]|nr:YkgJ family cysteine cluster protein [Candidatus Sumerlaeia bacterium]
MSLECQLENFVCKRCGNCCRGEGFVKITPEEARIIATFLKITVPEFYRNYTVKLADVVWLKDKPNKDCIFLEDNLCVIHPVKPKQCRDFPRKWHTADVASYCQGLIAGADRKT